MADILHKVGIKSSSLDDAYKALTTREGLSAWRTNNTVEPKIASRNRERRPRAKRYQARQLGIEPHLMLEPSVLAPVLSQPLDNPGGLDGDGAPDRRRRFLGTGRWPEH